VVCLGLFAYNAQLFVESLVFYSPSPNTATISGCIVAEGSSRIWFSYLSLTVFETVILLLTAYKTVRRRELKLSPLFWAIFNNGVAMYCYATVLSTINILVVNFAPADATNTFNGFHRVLHAILAERLVINIKRALNDPTLSG